MSPKPPARIRGFFAHDAPICVIVRRGPTRYTQMVLWHTDTDVFEPGQWIRGNVESFSLSLDGKYAAVKVMGTRPRDDRYYETQQALVCRPPYFTALEVTVGGLCSTHVYFLRDGRLYIGSSDMEIINATNECPITRVPPNEFSPTFFEPHQPVIDATHGRCEGHDQQGRRIAMEDGCVFVMEDGRDRLLFNANLYSFEAISPPAWAREW